MVRPSKMSPFKKQIKENNLYTHSPTINDNYYSQHAMTSKNISASVFFSIAHNYFLIIKAERCTPRELFGKIFSYRQYLSSTSNGYKMSKTQYQTWSGRTRNWIAHRLTIPSHCAGRIRIQVAPMMSGWSGVLGEFREGIDQNRSLYFCVLCFES